MQNPQLNSIDVYRGSEDVPLCDIVSRNPETGEMADSLAEESYRAWRKFIETGYVKLGALAVISESFTAEKVADEQPGELTEKVLGLEVEGFSGEQNHIANTLLGFLDDVYGGEEMIGVLSSQDRKGKPHSILPHRPFTIVNSDRHYHIDYSPLVVEDDSTFTSSYVALGATASSSILYKGSIDIGSPLLKHPDFYDIRVSFVDEAFSCFKIFTSLRDGGYIDTDAKGVQIPSGTIVFGDWRLLHSRPNLQEVSAEEAQHPHTRGLHRMDFLKHHIK